MQIVDPAKIAKKYLQRLKESVTRLETNMQVVGFIASDDPPSISYANATRRVFTDAGFNYDLRHVKRLELEAEIIQANADKDVHGIFIYFPVFGNQEDDYLRNLVHYTKDIEAGSLYWTRKLDTNDRSATDIDANKKALIPCTPLAIVKVLDDIGEYGDGDLPLTGKKITIFNRSQVIGRPLAIMMSNDGAKVLSFDEHGPLEFTAGAPRETSLDRSSALAQSDIIITGVPDSRFELVKPEEVSDDAVCLNFSSEQNFTEEIRSHVRTFIPRVGPMTVAMCMRNTIRLFEHFHHE
ncbi:MAG: bifunctional methylenetetrahydrofolate dehydrogenase/methenyltetrahydrofolate cyclohydrolase [Gammaproteobacteria bacterium]|jgi:methylenetetrahydrofolate dehydrogenase (NAD+)|nr:bifunctional methylenetetrahydrofolate dehydrogenase/methenyltetrahydrofolate cyclohydrolase [Gammaproteobacteria bacterium]MBT6582970.1 bifunctional methylenetetrahydrofolate dehydrogenase/methenyltetrahydrofolate cyclohydrolase [Gammaproteobacteria bacterium]